MPTFRDMPIKQKLMIVIVVTTGAALLMSGVGIVALDTILFRGYMERDISALARIIADNSTAALSFEDPRAATETLAALRARTHIVSACIYRANGTILASYLRPGTGAECPSGSAPGALFDEIRFTSAGLTANRPIVLQNRRIGTLVLLYDLGEIGERRRLYGPIVLGILLAASLIAFFLSSKLRALIATPISQLAHATASVSQTKDYSIRARKLSGDELGVLVDAFNEMLAGIQSRDKELRHALMSREDALREAQNARDSLETTLASIGDAVIATDIEGRVSFANPVALALLGWPEGGIEGRHLDDVFTTINEFSRARVESPVARVLREGAIVAMANHTILIAKDGTETPIDDSGAPIRREGGPIQGTVLVFRDVTARRRAEETSRLLASIVESSGDAIVAKDLNGIITSWNRGAERIFGYTAGEIIGRPISTIAAPDRLNEMSRILERIRNGERIDHFETVRRTRAGNLINVSLTVSPIYDALGRVIGASKIARDITGRVQATERLAQLNADLQRSNDNLARSNEDLERFAYVASHDLQEPLRMITVYSQLLVKTYPEALDDKAGAFVDTIVGGTQRMRTLLADLLAYTEVGSQAEAPVESVDLNAVVEIVRQNLNVSIEDSNAEVTADHLPVINAYEAHFISLFQNLIGNAIKYRGSQPPRIHISVGEMDGQLRFAVADNGMGIDSEYYDKIFVAFKRLHGKQIPGTGIGLAICQRVVERYGGRIWVESEPGRGSTFIFTLPGAAYSRRQNSGAERAGADRAGTSRSGAI
jgi:PAS domain S-box-containing protein